MFNERNLQERRNTVVGGWQKNECSRQPEKKFLPVL
jgi:hypothetical protein